MMFNESNLYRMMGIKELRIIAIILLIKVKTKLSEKDINIKTNM